MDPTFWVALFACVSSLGVGIIQHFSAKANAAKVKEVHDFVNSKDKENTNTITELRKIVEELQEEIVRRADAAPAQGSLPPTPQPVTIEGQKEVLDVAVKKPEK